MKTRFGSLVVQGLADFADGEVDRLLVVEMSPFAPQVKTKLLAPYGLAGAPGQKQQSPCGLRLERDRPACPREPERPALEFELAESQAHRGGLGFSGF